LGFAADAFVAAVFFVRVLGFAALDSAEVVDSALAVAVVDRPVRLAGVFFSAATVSAGCSLTFVLRVRGVFTGALAACSVVEVTDDLSEADSNLDAFPTSTVTKRL